MTGRRPFVLVVDDHRVIADTLTLILNRSGYEAMAFYSGEAAVEAVETLKPDVLISDVVMQGITGIEAAILIRQKVPECRIILFSGQAGTSDLMEGARQQGYTFPVLTKPVHPEQLLAHLRDGDAREF